jgi:hypothetical protein
VTAAPVVAAGIALASTALPLAVPRAADAQPVPARHALHLAVLADWTLSVSAPTYAAGLHGAVLTASRPGHRVDVPLDTTPTGRTARGVDALMLHAASGRLLVLTDRAYDKPGLIIVDLDDGAVVEAIVGRHMTVSPDARFVAFEEYYTRQDTPWPWNETVYAVVDVTRPAADLRRACPYDDDRCRGVLLHLPGRAEVCAAHRAMTSGASCLEPGRPPQHERRSPFVWLDDRTLAFVSVDHVRGLAVAVEAAFDDAGTPAVRRHTCDTTPDTTGARCPPTRTDWEVDAIRRDDGDGRLWLHFRDRLPEVPGGWLALDAGAPQVVNPLP